MVRKNKNQIERLKKARKKRRGIFVVRDSKVGRIVVRGRATNLTANIKKSSGGRYSIVSSTNSKSQKRRKPRGGLLHGEDPTLAKRVEEELYSFGR